MAYCSKEIQHAFMWQKIGSINHRKLLKINLANKCQRLWISAVIITNHNVRVGDICRQIWRAPPVAFANQASRTKLCFYINCIHFYRHITNSLRVYRQNRCRCFLLYALTQDLLTYLGTIALCPNTNMHQPLPLRLALG